MKSKFLAMFVTVALLLGMTGCSSNDDPAPVDKALEKSLVGLWWDEFEYSDVTEAGVPFSRVLLAVKADADHTGSIYLGVFNDKSDEPLALYGGPTDAGFTWQLLSDGSVLLSDPTTGESRVLTRGNGSSYGNTMTDVSSTNMTFANGSVTLTNGTYSGTLAKADAGKQAEIERLMAGQSKNIPLTIEALTDGTVVVDIRGRLELGMKYSVNGGSKTLINTSTNIPVSAGDKVQLYGYANYTQIYGSDDYRVSILGSGEGFKCKAYGNIMSLLDEENFATKTDLPDEENVFYRLFRRNTALTDASGLLLPATTLSRSCYSHMFSECDALTAAPALPATTLAKECYFGMFDGCDALTSAPALPATTLAEACYYYMFYGCRALTTAPTLPAPTLVSDCYYSMFWGCWNLNSVTCLATSGIDENLSTHHWLNDVAPTGTLNVPNKTRAKWPKGTNGIPSGWTGKYPDGSTWTPPRALAEATAEDVGKIATADGNIYDTKAEAEADGTTAVAMIAYVGTESDCSHGLAIALSNENGNYVDDWNAAKRDIESKAAVRGGTWRLPSEKDWQYMFIGCGSDEPYSPIGDYKSMDCSGFYNKLKDLGDTSMFDARFFTSTPKDKTLMYYVEIDAWYARFYYSMFDYNTPKGARACLAF